MDGRAFLEGLLESIVIGSIAAGLFLSLCGRPVAIEVGTALVAFALRLSLGD